MARLELIDSSFGKSAVGHLFGSCSDRKIIKTIREPRAGRTTALNSRDVSFISAPESRKLKKGESFIGSHPCHRVLLCTIFESILVESQLMEKTEIKRWPFVVLLLDRYQCKSQCSNHEWSHCSCTNTSTTLSFNRSTVVQRRCLA